MSQHSIWMDISERERLFKISRDTVGPAWETDKMVFYSDLKACCLDGEVPSWIKLFDAQKDVKQSTTNLRENYEGAGEFNKRVAW